MELVGVGISIRLAWAYAADGALLDVDQATSSAGHGGAGRPLGGAGSSRVLVGAPGGAASACVPARQVHRGLPVSLKLFLFPAIQS